jgi:hypothetical protein
MQSNSRVSGVELRWDVGAILLPNHERGLELLQ